MRRADKNIKKVMITEGDAEKYNIDKILEELGESESKPKKSSKAKKSKGKKDEKEKESSSISIEQNGTWLGPGLPGADSIKTRPELNDLKTPSGFGFGAGSIKTQPKPNDLKTPSGFGFF